MRHRYQILMLCGIVLASFANRGFAQTSGQTFHWLGDFPGAVGDVTNGGNWLQQPGPDTDAVPGPNDFLEIRWGDRAPTPLEYGSASATYERILFSHADVGTNINGTGTLTFTRSGGLSSVDVKSIESQGGHRHSVINPNIVSNGLIEARNGHDLEFNGNVTVPTIHAYVDDDGITTSDVIFNGPLTLTGYNEAKFMTGTGTVRFNNEVIFDHTVVDSGFGIRNGMTLILGQGFSAITFAPNSGHLGIGAVDMYNNSKVRLEGDNVVGGENDLFSRFGDGQNNTNTLDLNNHSDAVEYLGTHPGATFVIDFGATPGANSFNWETTHHHVGTYNFVNFEIGVDTLSLGSVGSTWWTAADVEEDGGGSPNIEVKKSHMSINGIPYHTFDAGVTTPYWTLVDPTLSRDVQFFNLNNLPNADFNGDDIVNGSDFLIWQRNLGSTNQTTNVNGDADRNGTVNAADLVLWKAAFGTPGAVGAISGVPEPSTALLVASGLAALVTVRRRRPTM